MPLSTVPAHLFLLTRLLRGATIPQLLDRHSKNISTHTPRAGRDHFNNISMQIRNNFYSHAPCGARLDSAVSSSLACSFLLTRPVRGATAFLERPAKYQKISTHTPRAGRDQPVRCHLDPFYHFYSHAPCGARLTNYKPDRTPEAISTHTPHAGRDIYGA